MTKKSNNLAFVALLLSLSSCASMEHGPSQNIIINTMPKIRSSCDIAGHEFKKTFEPPATITVPRSVTPLVITCHPPDGRGDGILTVKSKPVLANFIADTLTLGIAEIADPHAINKYPEDVVVTFNKSNTASLGEDDNTEYDF